MDPQKKLIAATIVLVPIIMVLAIFTPFTAVPAGHVGVTSLFGKVDPNELEEGFHIINPLKKVYAIDCRNKEHTLQGVGVPSRDQLTTEVDITVKWRVDKTMAAKAIQETGEAAALERVHLIPKFRSLTREAGKSVEKAEDFYQSEVQSALQQYIFNGLQELNQKGILVDDVLMRRVDLPQTIVAGVHEKKRREQLAEQQKAEFDRFKTEQQQTIAKAEADREAALQEAEQRKALADAKAYEITAEANARAEAIKIEGAALKNNSEVIRLRGIERWNGTVPKVSLSEGGGIIPMLNLGNIEE